MKTNVLVCLIILAGFLLTAVLSYHANYSASLVNVEQVSDLTSEGIYHQMNQILSKPVNVSLTMANDSLLKSFLAGETDRLDDSAYIETIAEYLHNYQQKYQYHAVFLASAATARYYNFNGLDRTLEPDDPENVWYYDLLEPSDEEYAMNVDNDQVAESDGAITLFVNCKIKDEAGALLGVVGVGVRIAELQQILRDYQEDFGVKAYFTDDQGEIELSAEQTGIGQASLFEETWASTVAKQDILEWKTDATPLSFWNLDDRGQKQTYVVARYLPEIRWHLIVERDTQALVAALSRQLTVTVLVIIVIVGMILLIITRLIRNFDKKIVTLTRTYEQQRKTMFEKATGQMFEDIYELDVTHNRPANYATEEYFKRLGAPDGTPFDQTLRLIADRQIKPAYRQGYVDTFSPRNVLEAFRQGTETLSYDFEMTNDGETYYWMRIIARLILSESDGSLHMLTYRQNINAEKQKEQRMLALAQTDETTGLLNKAATQRTIETMLRQGIDGSYAFFIFDIDHFKAANDIFGHAFGDGVIRSFVDILRTQFRRDDLIGRIGGDEFAAFLAVPDEAWAAQKAGELNAALDRDYVEGNARWHMSASIGLAIAPQDGLDFDTLYQHADAALYQTKKRSRGSHTLYSSIPQEDRRARD